MNHPHLFYRSCASACALASATTLAAAFCLPALAFAQQAPSSPPDDDIVMMSPFEVSVEKDNGYQATSSLAGGRIETDLKNTPASISILTKDFMDDLGLDSIQDFAIWSVSSEASDPGASMSDDFTISTRGLGNNVWGSRNYFRFYGNGDAYNTERLEFSRGPNALLFGESTLGGVTTTWTKQAKLRRKIASLMMKVDSEGSYRTAIDYNFSPSQYFAVRVNALYADSNSWREVQTQWQKDVHVATTIGITKRTQLRAEYQHSEKERTAGFNPYVDGISNWDPVNADNPNAAGTAAMASADILVWNAARPEDGILNWNGFRRTSGSGLYMSTDARPEIVRFPTVPNREFNTNAPSSTGLFKIDTFSVYLDQKIGKRLFVQAAYNYSKPWKTIDEVRWNNMYIDLNKNLPNGAENPYYLVPYGEASPGGRLQYNEVDEYRVMAVYSFQTSWTRQAFTLLANHRMDKYNYEQRRYVPKGIKSMNGLEETPFSSNNANDALRVRRYWNDLGPDSRPTTVTNDYGTFPFEYREYNTTYEENPATGIQLSNVGNYLNGRLTVIAGYRYDRVDKTSWRTAADPDPLSPNPSGRYPDGTTSYMSKSADPKSTAHSPSVGAVYEIVKGLRLSANYAKNFRPATAGNPDINGDSLGVTTGKGIDLGLRYELPGNKMYVSLNYYDSESYNSATTPASASTITADINRIWSAMNSEIRVPTTYTPRDRSDTKGTGWELELFYNPTKNWTMRLTGNLPYAEQYVVWPITKGYIATNRAAWQAFIDNEDNDPEARHTAAMNLMDLDNIMATEAADGARRTGSLQWRANYYTNYKFSTGLLRGLSIGGGATYSGKRLITRRVEDRSNIWADDQLIFTALLKYSFKLYKKNVTLQLNVDNLLDNDQLDYRTVTQYPTNSGTYYFNRYNYLNPRKFTLTAWVAF